MPRPRRKTWIEEPKQLHEAGKRLEFEHSARLSEVKAYLRLYYSRIVEDQTIDLERPYRETTVYEQLREVSGNLTREIVDAAIALICRPLKAELVPIGTDFFLQMGCRLAERLIDGVFDNCDFLDVATMAMTDAATGDIGTVKGYLDPVTGEIKFERIDPLEVYWPDDGTGDPRTLMHITGVPRDLLVARYPTFADRIYDLPTYRRRSILGVDSFSRPVEADTVRVTEAWAKQLSDKVPGRHVIVAHDLVLENEAWEFDFHPIAVCRWKPERTGFGGVSLGRIVAPYDLNNRRFAKMVYSGLSAAVPWVKITGEEEDVDLPSDVPFAKVACAAGSDVAVTMPQQVVSTEILQEMERNRQRAFQESGVNQQAATGSAPPSMSSGKAQETWIDIVNTRLLPAQTEWQRLWSQSARIVVMLAQHAKKIRVKVPGAQRLELASWPRLPDDKYEVSFGLSSGLGLTVSARFQNLQRLLEAGAIDVPEVLRGLDLPDTQELADRVNAPRDLVQQMIALALDGDPNDKEHKPVFVMPSTLQGPEGLQSIVTIGSQELQLAKLRGIYPKANMECLRRLIKAAEARLKPPPPPAPPPANDNGAPPPPMMMTPPMPPPANDNGQGPGPQQMVPAMPVQTAS